MSLSAGNTFKFACQIRTLTRSAPAKVTSIATASSPSPSNSSTATLAPTPTPASVTATTITSSITKAPSTSSSSSSSSSFIRRQPVPPKSPSHLSSNNNKYIFANENAKINSNIINSSSIEQHIQSNNIKQSRSNLTIFRNTTSTNATIYSASSTLTQQLNNSSSSKSLSMGKCPFAVMTNSNEINNNSATPTPTTYNNSNIDTSMMDNNNPNIRDFSEIPTPLLLPTPAEATMSTSEGAAYLHKYCDYRHKSLGPVYREKMGDHEIVFVSDADLMKQIYSFEGQYPVHYVPEAWTEFNEMKGIKRGLFFMDGPEWSERRRSLNRIFLKKETLSEYADDFNSVVSDLLCRWSKESKNSDQPLGELERELYNWSIESLGTMIFGRRLGCVVSEGTSKAETIHEFVQCIRQLFVESSKMIVLPARVAASLQSPVWKRFCAAAERALTLARGYVQQNVQEMSRNSSESNGTATSSLSSNVTRCPFSGNRSNTSAQKNNLASSSSSASAGAVEASSSSSASSSASEVSNGHTSVTGRGGEGDVTVDLGGSGGGVLELLTSREQIDGEEVVNIITDLFLAAADTTSHATQWALYLLAKHPECQEKLLSEVKQVLNGDSDIEERHLSDMSYVKGVIKESLRLYPVAPFLSRVLDKDITLNGYRVPAGKMLVMSLYTAGRDFKYFKDPDTFDPERWVRDPKTRLHQVSHPHACIPFGLGVRSCIGRRVAEMQMQFLLSRTIQKFQLSTDEPNIDIKLRMITTPEKQIKLKFKLRQEYENDNNNNQSR